MAYRFLEINSTEFVLDIWGPNQSMSCWNTRGLRAPYIGEMNVWGNHKKIYECLRLPQKDIKL